MIPSYKITTILILTLSIHKSLTQNCLIPNCLSCQSSPYICTQCPINVQCCQTQCSQCQSSHCIQCSFNYEYNKTSQICQHSDSCYQLGCNECVNQICVACIVGYVYNEYTYECLACGRHCQECTIQTSLNTICTMCQLTYYLANTTQNTQPICLPCQVPGCLICTNPMTCSVCIPGKVLNAQTCLSCPSNCLYCSWLMICSVCKQGYYLTTKNKCQACVSSCMSCYGSANNCTVCSSYQYLLDGVCFMCLERIPFCVSCMMGTNSSTSQLTCLTCASMYYAVNNTCQKCPNNCVVCTSSTKCTHCLQSFYPLTNSTTNSTACLPCGMPHCSTCYNSTACATCTNTYYPSSNSTLCLPCSPYCTVCKSYKQCQACAAMYYLSNGACLPCGYACSVCLILRSSGKLSCSQCINGYYLQTNNHTLLGRCYRCPHYCLGCSSRTQCSYCAPGYYLDQSNACIACTVSGCFNCNTTTYISDDPTNYTQIDICTLCYPTYYITYNQLTQYTSFTCLRCVDNCLFCDSGTECIICQPGFYVSDDHTVCYACLWGCYLCVDGSGDGSGCLECQDGYYMMQQQVQQQQGNISASVSASINYICMQCPSACTQCYSQNICKSCRSGYYLNSYQTGTQAQGLPICYKCSTYCLTCTDPNTCTSCHIMYYLQSNGSCMRCRQGFLLCDGNVDMECMEGYGLHYRNYYWQLSNIQHNTNTNTNTNTNNNSNSHSLSHSLSHSNNTHMVTCQKCPQYCKSCSTSYNNQTNAVPLCSICYYGYTLLYNGSCILCGQANPGCQVCDGYGQCAMCYAGYTLNTSGSGCVRVMGDRVEDWPLIGASVGLGCLLMFLIIVVLYQKMNAPKRLYSMRIQLVEETANTQVRGE